MNLRFLALPCRRHLGLYWLYNRSLKIHVISGRKKWEWSVANSPRSKRAWGRGKSFRLPPILFGFRSWVMVAYEQAPAGGGGRGWEIEWRKGDRREMPFPLLLPRLLSVHPIPGGGGRRGGLLSIVANTRKGVPFSRGIQIYERVGIALVEVYERLGKST